MKRTCYNEPSLELMFSEAYKELNKGGVNIVVEPYSKPKTKKQMCFFWGILVDQILDFLKENDPSWTEEAVKECLYSVASNKIKIAGFNGEIIEVPKRISNMDRKEMSEFISKTIDAVDNCNIFRGIVLTPEARYCWIHNVQEEDIMNLERRNIQRKDNEYLEYIRNSACIVCGKTHGIEAHHLKKAGESGTAYKTDDAFAVPLCSEHHRMYHIKGKEWFDEQIHWITDYTDVYDFALMLYNRWKNHL